MKMAQWRFRELSPSKMVDLSRVIWICPFLKCFPLSGYHMLPSLRVGILLTIAILFHSYKVLPHDLENGL